jgi:transposase
MEKVKAILKMHEEGFSYRDIALSAGCGKTAVGEVVERAREAGLLSGRHLPEAKLEERLRPARGKPQGKGGGLDMGKILVELSRKNVTRQLLWEEYREDNPDGLMYSQFCELVRRALKEEAIDFHKRHNAGEECEVDWAGSAVPFYDAEGRAWSEASVFVAVLPASVYPFAYAYRDQKMGSWIDAHVRMLEFFGGAPKVLRPDCAKTAVARADLFDPVMTRTYMELAAHYGITVVPARPYKPTDKNYVENTVQNVSRRILAPLRDSRFASVAEINGAIAGLLQKLIDRPFRKMPGCRRSAFEQIDRPALRPLPASRYEMAVFEERKIGINYHVEFDGFWYSAPFEHRGKKCAVRATPSTVEVFVGGEAVCAHPRNYNARERYRTLQEHLPESHKAVSEWNDERFLSWAGKIGPETAAYVRGLLANAAYSVQAYRACMGVLRQTKDVPREVAEAASRLAAEGGQFSSKYYGFALKRAAAEAGREKPERTVPHGNIRGRGAFAGGGCAQC